MGAAFGAVAIGSLRLGRASAAGADLTKVKAYVVEQAKLQKEATATFRQIVDRYYTLAEAVAFDYAALWAGPHDELVPLLAAAKQTWLEASSNYELNEGLIAGVPSLSYYDVWIDAGPSAEDDPENALDWTLELPDGTELEKPGNFFSHLTEPALYGTNPAFVGLLVDLDGDGQTGVGDVLPDANVLAGAARGLDDATGEMQAAVEAWEPTLEDAFGALTVMIPTMSEYFGQWRNSVFVAGEAAEEQAFVAVSRLADINGIVHGLDVTYDVLRPEVQAADTNLDSQIDSGFAALSTFVSDLYEQESGGKRFFPEEAELLGTQAEAKAATLVGYVSQAVALLDLSV
jgi:hypothetical protein